MNIIFDTENLDHIKNNNILLELDTFYISTLKKTTTAFCVVDNVNLTNFDKIPQLQLLHNKLVSAYKNKNFKLCQELADELTGSFDGELDSFYSVLKSRAQQLDSESLADDWTNVIFRED